MHILITGAAGMIGRKLTARLVKDGSLNGQSIERLTLVDVVAPDKPAGFSGAVENSASDSEMNFRVGVCREHRPHPECFAFRPPHEGEVKCL